jgi:hypothetical protein
MEKRYKFKSLQTFCNNEWMVNNQKRYRTVFDKIEIDYVRIELALYNKLFDEPPRNKLVNPEKSGIEIAQRRPLIGYNPPVRRKPRIIRKDEVSFRQPDLRNVFKANYQPFAATRTDATIAPAYRDVANDVARVDRPGSAAVA